MNKSNETKCKVYKLYYKKINMNIGSILSCTNNIIKHIKLIFFLIISILNNLFNN